MKKVFTLFLFTFALFHAACGVGGTSTGGGQTIKSTRSGDMNVALSGAGGQLKKGENELLVTFTGAADQPLDVGAVSLNFHMAAMGSMAEMNDRATLTTTETPGRYRARVNVEMGGTWEAQIAWQGAHGTGKVTMNVQAK
ncbi:MAG: FixH family protein [Blastocatellia bacterium]